jgi:hypothetical protein
MVSSACGYERNGLERLGGRAQVGHKFGLAQIRDNVSFSVNGNDMAAMARFCNLPARDFDQRSRLRNVLELCTHV